MSLPLFILTDKLYEQNIKNKLVESSSKSELSNKKYIKSPRLMKKSSRNKSMDNFIKFQSGWYI